MKTQTTQTVNILSIGGSDTSGGAGVQADLKTFASLNCYGLSVFTCLTAQNTNSIDAIYKLPVDFLEQQILCLVEDLPIHAIKIGVLSDLQSILKLSELLKYFKDKPIVFDPVMASSTGTPLLEKNALEELINSILPKVTLLTPNIPEAEILTNKKIKTHQNMEESIYTLSKMTPAVLIKGGHINKHFNNQTPKQISDLFLEKNCIPQWFHSDFVNTSNTHGTGCTLSSAITCYLAKGTPLKQSVIKGRFFLTSLLVSNQHLSLGKNIKTGPTHFF